jgi:cytochrome P450
MSGTALKAPEGSGLKEVPGDPGLPLLGQTLETLRDPLGTVDKRVAKYGPVFWGRFLRKTMVTVVGPEAAETVLLNRDKAFASGPAWSYFIGPFFNRGIMLLDFEEHMHHRRIMQQAFTKKRLAGYHQAITPAITAGLDAWKPGRQFAFRPNIKQLTLDLATDVFVGVELSRREADRINRAFIDSVLAATAIVRFPLPGGRWWNGLQGRKVLEDFFYTHLPEKRRNGGDDLFAALCEAQTDDGHRFTDEDVVNHMIFVLMAAHDTSTISLAMMVYYLARHPEWQDRLRDESDALGTDTPGYEELAGLQSMELVFRETLRINPPVGMIARRAVKDAAIDGHHIPAGALVMLEIYPSHRMEPWWHDPDRFDPERFSPERREDQSHQYAWVPFGGNVHKCIGMHFGGMEIKAILHRLLRTRRFSIPPGYAPPIDFATGPFPADGLPLTLSSR